MDDKAHGLSFRDTLVDDSEQNMDVASNKETHFVIDEADVKLFQDDGVLAIVFLDRA